MMANSSGRLRNGPKAGGPRPQDRQSRPAHWNVPRARIGAKRPPASTEGCSIADTSNMGMAWPESAPIPAPHRGESASILASVPPDVNTTSRGSRPDQCGDLFARLLDEAARGPAFGMDRGRIAGDIERRNHGGAGLAAQRRRRIPVEIDPLSHGLVASRQTITLYNISARSAECPLKFLLFVPAAVLESARRERPVPPAILRRPAFGWQNIEWS